MAINRPKVRNIYVYLVLFEINFDMWTHTHPIKYGIYCIIIMIMIIFWSIYLYKILCKKMCPLPVGHAMCTATILLGRRCPVRWLSIDRLVWMPIHRDSRQYCRRWLWQRLAANKQEIQKYINIFFFVLLKICNIHHRIYIYSTWHAGGWIVCWKSSINLAKVYA